jgi:hypothetical protein
MAIVTIQTACVLVENRAVGGDAVSSERRSHCSWHSSALFAWFISHQPTILFSQNKPATSNQPAVLLSQNKSAPASATSQTNMLPRFQIDQPYNVYWQGEVYAYWKADSIIRYVLPFEKHYFLGKSLSLIIQLLPQFGFFPPNFKTGYL